MANRYLLRDDAPLKPETWDMLDKIAAESAKTVLAGRRMLYLSGPHGLGLKGVPLPDAPSEAGIVHAPFAALSLITKSFSIAKRDLAQFEQTGLALDVRELFEAAIEAARLEDNLILWGSGELTGLLTAPGVLDVKLSGWEQVGNAANELIQAVTRLDDAGFHGPYSLALSPRRYNLLLRQYPNSNQSELDHVKTIATDGVHKAPVLNTGGILLNAGRQVAELIVGQDMSVGFIGPTAERLEFLISESLAVLIHQPAGICALKE